MKKILIAAYRDWGVNVYNVIKQCSKESIRLVSNEEELETLARNDKWDAIILVGWSWKIPDDIVENCLVVGMHPSDLPNYAGGSPIQHQIIDGLLESKATIFRLTKKFDAGEIYGKESYGLQGHLDDVLKSIENATIRIISQFIEELPNVKFTPQESGGFVKRRLKPENSMLTVSGISSLTCEQLYNHIRCREDPYPNVYMEDRTGKLVFKTVEFYPKEEK